MITHYPSSKGDMEIATMNYPHLKNATNKVEREMGPDSALFLALKEELDRREADFAAEQARLAAEGLLGGDVL